MSVLKKEEYFESIRGIIGDRSDAQAVKFLEDMTDTFNAQEKGIKGDGVDWEKKFRENDKAWSERYRNRFMYGDGGNGPSASGSGSQGGYDPEAVTIADLFKS